MAKQPVEKYDVKATGAISAIIEAIISDDEVIRRKVSKSLFSQVQAKLNSIGFKYSKDVDLISLAQTEAFMVIWQNPHKLYRYQNYEQYIVSIFKNTLLNLIKPPSIPIEEISDLPDSDEFSSVKERHTIQCANEEIVGKLIADVENIEDKVDYRCVKAAILRSRGVDWIEIGKLLNYPGAKANFGRDCQKTGRLRRLLGRMGFNFNLE